MAAVDSVTFVRGPFSVTDEHNFSSDQRTRIIFFTTDLGFAQPTQADINTLSVQLAGDSYPVESVGPSSFSGVAASYIVLRLPVLSEGDYPLSIRLNGVNSANSPTLKIVAVSSSSPASIRNSNKLRIAEYLLYPLIYLLL